MESSVLSKDENELLYKLSIDIEHYSRIFSKMQMIGTIERLKLISYGVKTSGSATDEFLFRTSIILKKHSGVLDANQIVGILDMLKTVVATGDWQDDEK